LNINYEQKEKNNYMLYINNTKDRNGNLVQLRADIMMNASGNTTYDPNLYYRKLMPHLLRMNWSNVSTNGSDVKNLLKLLEQDFDVKWAIPNNSNISLKHFETIYTKNEEVTIENEDKYSNDCVNIQINNSTINRGKALMNISGLTTYDLNFVNDAGKGNKGKWICDWNGLLKFHVNDFSSRDRLVYWYYVKPKKSGAFHTESMVRISDKAYAGWPDITYPIDIDVNEPDLRFNVTPILDSSNVYADGWYSGIPGFKEMLNLKYSINYIGSAGVPYTNNVPAKWNEQIKDEQIMSSYHIYDNGKPDDLSRPLNLDFSKKKRYTINKSIIYDKEGKYQIPGLLIGDKSITFSNTITVDNPISRNKEIILFSIAVIGFLLGLVFNKELKNSIKSLKRKLVGSEKTQTEKDLHLSDQTKPIEDQIIKLNDKIMALEEMIREKKQ
jgi:hypothetical protein